MRTKTITYNPNNYQRDIGTQNVYSNKEYKIKEQKTVQVNRPNFTKTKVVKYGPVNQFGKQTKEKNIIKIKK